MISWVAQHGVDGVSNYIADQLAAEGEPELADAVRLSGDVIESLISTARDATACGGRVALGAAIGAAAFGPLGAGAGLLLGAFNSACKNTLTGILSTGEDIANAADAIADAYQEAQCGPGTMFTEDTAACIEACDSSSPGWCAFAEALLTPA